MFSQHHLPLSDHHLSQFNTLYDLFTDWNTKINLSAIRERDDVFLKHFVDALLPTKHLDFNGKKIADLGTGGGFPSLPLGIVTEGSTIHGFDSVGKKLRAVQDMADQLDLNVKTFHGRLEAFGQDPTFREQYDIVTARALAPWPVLLEYALPFVAVGGTFVAYQGPGIVEEWEKSKKAVGSRQYEGSESVASPPRRGGFGGVSSPLGTFTLTLHREPLGTTDTRILCLLQKTSPTPKKYPREVGVPRKEPLTL